MATAKEKAERRAQGLCVDCGSARTAPGNTLLRCAVCAEKWRVIDARHRATEKYAQNRETRNENRKARRAARDAAGLCVRCGGKRTKSGRKTCRRCAVLIQNQAIAERAEKRKHSYYGAGRNGRPLLVGGAAPRIGVVKTYHLSLGGEAWDALVELKRRDREKRLKAGLDFEPFRVSAIVRETLSRFERVRCPGRRHNRLLRQEYRLSFCADARTVAIVEKAARRTFDGNCPAAIRAMLCAAVQPPRNIGSVGSCDDAWTAKTIRWEAA